MPSSAILLAATLSSFASTALAQGKKAGTDASTITLSGDVAVGVFFGIFIIGVLVFAVTMLTSIEPSDKLGQPKSS